MNSYLKKVLCIILALSTIMTSSLASGFADTNEIGKNKELTATKKTLSEAGFNVGESMTVKSIAAKDENIIIIADSNTDIGSIEIGDNEIAIDNNGNYFLQVQDDVFIEADSAICELKDMQTVEKFIAENDYEQETIDDIICTAQSLFEMGETGAVVNVLSTNDNSNSKSTTYTTYGGYQMKVETVSYSNIPTTTKTIYKGVNTKDKSKLMFNLLLSGMGFEEGTMVSKKIPYISAAVSVFEYFKKKYQENLVPGTTKDFDEVNLSFDRTDKRVFVKDAGQWYHCLDAEYVKIRRLYVRICLFNKEKTKCYERTKETYPDTIFKTESYNSPYKNALKAHHSHFFNEYITWKAGGKTFTFGV